MVFAIVRVDVVTYYNYFGEQTNLQRKFQAAVDIDFPARYQRL